MFSCKRVCLVIRFLWRRRSIEKVVNTKNRRLFLSDQKQEAPGFEQQILIKSSRGCRIAYIARNSIFNCIFIFIVFGFISFVFDSRGNRLGSRIGCTEEARGADRDITEIIDNV